jgi:Na+/H+ antiporter NhaC
MDRTGRQELRYRALRITASVFLLIGWALLLRGLYLLPVSDDTLLDLEAGPAFAINLWVYLPSIALTAALLVSVPLVVFTRVGSVVGIGVGLIAGGFAAWVHSRQELLDYIPGLVGALWLAGAFSIGAVTVLVVEESLRRSAPEPLT